MMEGPNRSELNKKRRDDQSDSDSSNENVPVGASSKKRRGNLPKESVELLKRWIYDHRYNPYPTEEEKESLCTGTRLTSVQVSNWFINARRRVLPQMLIKEGKDPRKYTVAGKGASSPELPTQRGHAALPSILVVSQAQPARIVSVMCPVVQPIAKRCELLVNMAPVLKVMPKAQDLIKPSTSTSTDVTSSGASASSKTLADSSSKTLAEKSTSYFTSVNASTSQTLLDASISLAYSSSDTPAASSLAPTVTSSSSPKLPVYPLPQNYTKLEILALVASMFKKIEDEKEAKAAAALTSLWSVAPEDRK